MKNVTGRFQFQCIAVLFILASKQINSEATVLPTLILLLASHVYKRFFEIDTDPRRWYRSKNYGYAQEWLFLGVNIFTLCLWRPHNGQKAQQNGGGSEIPLKSTVMSCQLKRNLRGRQHLNHPPVPHDVIVATGWKWMKLWCEWLEGTGPPEPLADAKQAHESWREVPEHTHTSLPAAALLF